MSDIIAAIATPAGVGAIGVIRLSGGGAIELADKIFHPISGRPLSKAPDRTMVLGTFYDPDGGIIDRCLGVKNRAPHSYTGEDTVEFHCHGGMTVLTQGLNSLFAAGARQALPGEFTKRAFLNGRMDLIQAEAVIDLIEAETPGAAQNAAGQLFGAMSRRIEVVYSGLVDLMAHFHAVLDWPDEDIDPFEAAEIEENVRHWGEELERLLATFERGQLMRDGVRCAIIGRPNVGKSSLLNALAGFERAIVTDIPGTTRDTVEERVQADGLMLCLTDTAGLREADDAIEKIGVQRAKDAAQAADVVIAVFDSSRDWDTEDDAVLKEAKKAKRAVIVLSKCDLPSASMTVRLPSAIRLSSATGQGLKELIGAIGCLLPQSSAAAGEMLTNARQAEAVKRASVALTDAVGALGAGYTPDAVLMNIEDALSALGELSGKTIKEDITERIFQRFCVGK